MPPFPNSRSVGQDTSANKTRDSGETSGFRPVASPSVQLPKGGGAIRGIGEKFAANPVTGTGSMSVPIAVSPGRAGFGPQLSLSYDSGAGNGPFGFGWSLSLPAITRKTDKGLPRYFDNQESDVFILSGAEDLVPEFKKDDNGDWVLQDDQHVVHDETRTVDGVVYRVRRYRPRIEGLFARIERWTNVADATDTFWRSISKDNITTWYGKTRKSRIADPGNPGRIFSWLICQSYDDKGNAIVYEYVPEDDRGVDHSQANERNRVCTANRYLKRIKYGNRTPNRDLATWQPTDPTQLPGDTWMFEVVFDYDEGHVFNETTNADQQTFVEASTTSTQDWTRRLDPFSSYRAGFEVRTYRLCQRTLMFHHFPGEADVGQDCLVRSTDFTYSYEENPQDARNPIYSFLISVEHCGYKRQNGVYLKRSLPPLEFEYTQPNIQEAVEEVDAASLANLPIGVDGAAYQWTDLHGEGIPGILTEQAGAWFYKRNLSPISERPVELAPVELVATKPNLALGAGAQFMDLAGDGQPDLVVLDGPMPGFYEHDVEEGWQPFRPFTSRLSRDTRDPNLKFVDLNGDGHADVLLSEDDILVWHPSLAEQGFGPANRVHQALDEEKGPRLVFADGTQSVYLADLSGDGLTDLARIRNSEVCYWPNLGYGRFGAKVTMDNAPRFDSPDQFDQKRVQLADIDGSGTTDIIYLHRDGVRLYFNQSGNSWSAPVPLRVFPRVDDLVAIAATDLLGNGTACLVWSSPLPGDAQRQMRYVNLMGGQKPHLLVKTVNNLGAETRVQYAPSTKFYLQDKRDGKPWITRLPFPVYVVERVETYDHVSRNRFVTRYAYHHGYFDGEEREFRGFGMVEQTDTEEFAAFTGTGVPPSNADQASHVPPVLTRTWFHTGVYLGRDRVSNYFADLVDGSDRGEYYREPGWLDDDDEARERLLPDTVLPSGLTLDEEREAARSLKGMMLRQEVYARDGVGMTPDCPNGQPYTVAEQNFTVRPLQPRGGNRHAVFFTHPREVITYHYERNPADPRIQHALTLEVDAFGNVLKQAATGYGRRKQIRVVDDQGNVQQVPNPGLTGLDDTDQAKQTTPLLTYTENRVTHAVDTTDDRRTPLPCESRTYELTGLPLPSGHSRFSFDELLQAGTAADELDYEKDPTAGRLEKRLIEHVRSYYRANDLSGSLQLCELQSLALPHESYKLAFTPGLVTEVYGDRVTTTMLENEGRYVHTEGDGNWWIHSGQIFYSPDPGDVPAVELAYARQHFFLPHRFRDPFHTDAVSTEGFVTYDAYNLLLQETKDALDNRVTVDVNDYRVLQPRLVSDPNRNRSEVAFDALGMVVGTAVIGKIGEDKGDLLDAAFVADLDEATVQDHLADPLADPHAVLQHATTRLVYDLFAYRRTKDQSQRQSAVVYTLARETHHFDLAGQQTKIQHSFSYSDGFGREIQEKIQAEDGPLDVNNPRVPAVSPRWVGSGWTIFNNKGKPVRQYEPFFSATHHFEFGVMVGVSPVLFYDPAERVIATLHPNHTYEKVVFDPWQQTTYDVNDTCAPRVAQSGDPRPSQTGDPRTDPNIGGYVAEYFKTQPATWQTWRKQRIGGALGPHEQAAAARASAHANTPTTAHFDALGRPFLTVACNRVVCKDHPLDGKPDEDFRTRVEHDIEGNQRAVLDERKLPDANGVPLGAPEQRIVMRYDYDMLGNRIHQLSMEAGGRWTLGDVAGKPIRAWDSRGHNFITTYDALRRPVEQFVRGTTADSDPRTLNPPNAAGLLVDKIEYGEGVANAEALNLRTRIYRHFDSAGVATNARLNVNGDPTEAYDFKGNLLRSTRRLVSDYSAIPDWLLDPQLDAETFEGSTRYDALNRPIQSVAPHSSLTRAGHPNKFNVIQPVFNEANLLERVNVWLECAAEPTGLLIPANEAPSPVGVADIDYDAKGQRTLIDYKTSDATVIRTTYAYDRQTFRLTHLYTRRGVDPNTANGVAFTADCDNPTSPPPTIAAPEQPPAGNACGLQNLHYTYDPAGNISHIRDDAQQTIYFKNQRVEPSNDYTYDAVYRLIEATGREHLGQVGGAPIPHSHDDAGRVGLVSADAAGRFAPSDGTAMGRYIERYVYDAVGNFLQMQHHGSAAVLSGWTRAYTYDETSLIEDGADGTPPKTSNRLSSTTVGANPVENYTHDVHGNMTGMPHLNMMQWDFKDQLHATSRQVVNDTPPPAKVPETTYYVYDAAGQRVRKVTNRQNGTRKEERIYLGGYEVHRKYDGAGNAVTLERETVHVMDDKQRIALVETRTLDTAGNDQAPRQLIRYQFGNHLGSASLELDDHAQIISYEEYVPYGSSTYQAVRRQTETAKRYRYTGKERDEESGLFYHGARYYAAWLGRWTSCDPKAMRVALRKASGEQSRMRGNLRRDEEKHLVPDVQKRRDSYAVNDSLIDPPSLADIAESRYCYTGSNPVIHVDDDGLEKIVVVGNQGYSPKSDRTGPASKEGYRYGKYTRHFLQSGLNQARKYKSSGKEQVTMVIYKGNYSQKELDKYQQAAAKSGITTIIVNSAKEIANYVNTQDSRVFGSDRADDLVTSFAYVGHGWKKGLYTGYNAIENAVDHDPLHTKDLEVGAFALHADILLNSCASGYDVMDDFVNRLTGGTVTGYTTTIEWGEKGIGSSRPYHLQYYDPHDPMRNDPSRPIVPEKDRIRIEQGKRTK